MELTMKPNYQPFFNKVFTFKGKEFIYSPKECLLKYVTRTDVVFDKNNHLVEVRLDKPMVIDSVGLRKENAENGLYEYVMEYAGDIDEECRCLAAEFI
jgi:hypothetical protein